MTHRIKARNFGIITASIVLVSGLVPFTTVIGTVFSIASYAGAALTAFHIYKSFPIIGNIKFK